MIRILLVEDDPNLRDSVTGFLVQEGYEVVSAGSRAEARARLAPAEALPDLIILDWMLPDGQGIDWLRELREKRPTLPVIMLTSRAELVDKVVGLESGANDYLTKPFEPRELVARIRVQLRQAGQTRGSAPAGLEHAGIRLTRESREVTFRGAPVELTRMEYELLRLLVENPGKVFSRDELLNKVWGYERFPTTRTVDTHVLQLRQKLDDGLFETVRGVGYRLRRIDPKLTGG